MSEALGIDSGTYRQLQKLEHNISNWGFTWDSAQSFRVVEMKNRQPLKYYLQVQGQTSSHQWCVMSDETTSREAVERLRELAIQKRWEYKQAKEVDNDSN